MDDDVVSGFLIPERHRPHTVTLRLGCDRPVAEQHLKLPAGTIRRE
jgi:hypothetical protein